MTPQFMLLFYAYGAVYVLYQIHSIFFTKTIDSDSIGISFDSIEDMAANPAGIPQKLSDDINKVKPYLPQLPIMILNFAWLVIGLYTPQSKLFIAIICFAPIEVTINYFVKSIPEKILAIILFIARIAAVGAIYYFKFFN